MNICAFLGGPLLLRSTDMAALNGLGRSSLACRCSVGKIMNLDRFYHVWSVQKRRLENAHKRYIRGRILQQARRRLNPSYAQNGHRIVLCEMPSEYQDLPSEFVESELTLPRSQHESCQVFAEEFAWTWLAAPPGAATGRNTELALPCWSVHILGCLCYQQESDPGLQFGKNQAHHNNCSMASISRSNCSM